MTSAPRRRIDMESAYLDWKTKNMQGKWDNQLRSIGEVGQLEPASARFVTKVDVDFLKIVNKERPWKAKPQIVATATLRPETVDELKRIEAVIKPLGYELTDVARTGAVYLAGFPGKRVNNLHQGKQYWDDKVAHWKLPWWKEKAWPKFDWLLDYTHKQTIHNIETIVNLDPQLAVGSKMETTGTGWRAPLNNRAGLRDHLSEKYRVVENIIDDYYRSLREAVADWPGEGATITTSEMWHGILGGSRSDGTVLHWPTYNTQIIESEVREVGTDPSSAFHNPELNKRQDRIQVWKAISPPTTLIPFMPDEFVEAFKYPPVTVPWAHEGTEPKLNCSTDFGWTDGPPEFTQKGFTRRKETVKFGADQCVLSGIYLLTGEQDMVAMMISGCPFTMTQYQHLHWPIYELESSIRIMGVGDDQHMIGRYDALGNVAAHYGSTMRTKGMKTNMVFILGHWIVWPDPEHVVAFITPRFLKSVASPKQAAGVGTIKPGEKASILISSEADEQEAREWKSHAKHNFFSGTRSEWHDYLNSTFVKDKLRAAASGDVSAWFTDFMNTGMQVEEG